MKWATLMAILALVSCNQKTKSIVPDKNTGVTKEDTVIVKTEIPLNPSVIGFYSKSFGYIWLAGKDTLALTILANEHEKDSTIHLSILHKEPILFTTALARIKDCLDLIKEDFYLSKFNSIYFRSSIYYPDLAKKLSNEYERKFGRKNTSYKKLNQFLLESSLNSQLNNLLQPLNKKVRRLGIEKFHLLHKKGYLFEIPNINIAEYPDFTIHGFGINVQLISQ